MLSHERLSTLLNRFPSLTIGLVGDLFLDRYLDIDPELTESSIETGLEAYQVTRVRNSPGALGTVINNLVALGVTQLLPVSVLGDDGQAFDLLQALSRQGINLQHVLRDPARLTPTYTKPMRRDPDGTWRELNRIDLRNRSPLARDIADKLLAEITAVFESTDGLIVLDQVNEEGWGVVGPRVRQHLASLAETSPDQLMFIDSRAHVGEFSFGVLKPNVAECLSALKLGPGVTLSDREAAQSLSNQTGCPLFCTLGARGMLVVRPEIDPIEVPGIPINGPIDPVGAGDSATAGIVASLLSGATPVEAAMIGNLVASVTVQQLGTTGTAMPAQVLAAFDATANDQATKDQ